MSNFVHWNNLMHFMISPTHCMVSGTTYEREIFYQKMKLLGMNMMRRTNYDLIMQKNIRSVSENHITIHNNNGTRVTWGKSSPQRVLEAMQDHNRNGYVRYKHKGKDYHQNVKRGTINRPTELWETWHWNEPWIPLSPRIEGWIQIVQF